MHSLPPIAGMISRVGIERRRRSAARRRRRPPRGTRPGRGWTGTGACPGRGPRRVIASTMCAGVGVSGSPIPSEITSTPAASLLRDLALELGEQVRRDALEALRLGAHDASSSARTNSSRELAREHRLGPAGQGDVEIARSTSTSSSPPSSTTVTGLGAPRSTAATAAPDAPVPDESVSPTPRSKIRARTCVLGRRRRMNDTFVRFGNSSLCSIGGPERRRGRARSSSSPDLDHALRVADADVLELELPPRRRRACRGRPRPPDGKSGDVERWPGPSRRGRSRVRGDRRP